MTEQRATTTRSQPDARRWNTASLAAANRDAGSTRGAGRGSDSWPGQDAPAVPGFDAGDQFPDLHVKQPAPRVDATHSEATSGPRYEQRTGESGPDRESRQRGTDDVERAVEEAFFRRDSGLSAYDSEVDRVVDRLYREVERKMRIERERRGL